MKLVKASIVFKPHLRPQNLNLKPFLNLSPNGKYFITFQRRVSKLTKNAFSLDFGHLNRFSYFGTDEGTKR